jgi:hypothetical protein
MSGEPDWTPDTVQPPDYPPPDGPRAGDMERATHPRPNEYSAVTAWQKLQAERAAQQSEGLVWPAGLTDAARTELLRCADAFDATAARLRRIVSD